MSDVRIHHGQAYGRMGFKPHICRDGRETILVIWGSYCAQCGRPFTFTAPAKARTFQPNRRCQRCKRPGQRVRGQS